MLPQPEGLIILLPVLRPVLFLHTLQGQRQRAQPFVLVFEQRQLLLKGTHDPVQRILVKPGLHLHILGHGVNHGLIHQLPVGGGLIGIRQISPVQNLGARRAQAHQQIGNDFRTGGGGGDGRFNVFLHVLMPPYL